MGNVCVKLQKLKEIEDATKQDKILWQRTSDIEIPIFNTVYKNFEFIFYLNTGSVVVIDMDLEIPSDIFLGQSSNLGYLIDCNIQRQETRILEGLNFDEN